MAGLPTKNVDWPPKEVRDANSWYSKYAAWHGGDPVELSKAYATTIGFGQELTISRPAQYAGGIIGLAARMFWGSPPPSGALRSSKLHIPLAGDIASVSANLLFGEPPSFNPPDDAGSGQTPTSERLETLLDEGGWHAVFLEAAEICSAYGGVYLRIGWDEQIAGYPLIDAIPPDAAVPEWRSGRLVAVTFWRELSPQGDGKTWRHLERHEPGRIYHGTYASSDKNRLGRVVALQDHPETEIFATLVNAEGYVETGAKWLTAEYVPNIKPHRKMRGSQLGRSDYDGVEPIMDALDEAWTSWMRDLRIGKGRVYVPEVYLQSMGPGKGSYWDAEQEVYQAVNALPGSDGLSMQVVQFQIRVAEHEQTCAGLTSQVVRGAGYSVQTFGESGDVVATATEVVARERRSYITRAQKINYWRAVLSRLIETALEVDVAKFHPDGVEPMQPDIEWPDGVAVDPQSQAQTLQLLDAAKAVSTRTKVEMLHQDWDDQRVEAEVKAIDAQNMPPGLGVPGAATGGFPHTAGAGGAADTVGGGGVGAGVEAQTGDTRTGRPVGNGPQAQPPNPEPMGAGSPRRPAPPRRTSAKGAYGRRRP